MSIDGGKTSVSGSMAKSIAEDIFNDINECHFGSGKKSVCSPKSVISKMKTFVEKNGQKVDNDPKKIISTMKNMLNCESESCLLKRKDFVEFANEHNLKDVLDKFFKPSGPATHFGLLSNFNIDDVLDQFEKRFDNRKFLHIPFQMRDFEKVGTQLATTDLADKFREKYNTFGVVLNTDWSSGGGIHWFCIFGENLGNKIELEYFNSSGKEPLPEVQAWLQKTKHYLQKELKIPVEIRYTTGIRFQSDEHSCGVYCLCYIWLRLEKVPPTWFKPELFGDQQMHKVRKNLFRHEQ
jgi:hypothetical protein